MAYTKQTVSDGQTITADWGNHIQTQYDEAASDLNDHNTALSHKQSTGCQQVGSNSNAVGSSNAAVSDNASAKGMYSLASQGTYFEVRSGSDSDHRVTVTGTPSLAPGELVDLLIEDGPPLVGIRVLYTNGSMVYLSTTSSVEDAVALIKRAASPNAVSAEGFNSLASGEASHAEGKYAVAAGACAHAEGYNNKATGKHTHAEGYGNVVRGDYSHVEGLYNTITGLVSHAEGSYCEASGTNAHSEGYFNLADGNYSHAAGNHNTAKYCQTVIGQYCTISSASNSSYDASKELFIIGNGTSTDARGNAFKVLGNGQTYADGAYSSSGADYAEMFEWLDGNPDNEDRVGYFVTLDGEKICKATGVNDYILGVVSGMPTIVGDNDMRWGKKYLADEWGRVQYHEVLVPFDELTNTPEHYELHPVYNPEWDPTLPYTERINRPEWAAVGLMGKLLVRDDGSCRVNGYCRPNADGIATDSITGYRVMKRVAENIVQILVK